MVKYNKASWYVAIVYNLKNENFAIVSNKMFLFWIVITYEWILGMGWNDNTIHLMNSAFDIISYL